MIGYKKILIAFILNILFAIIEFIGGIVTGSIAILSDAVHDIGDSLSIGISYIMERLSVRSENHKYTYGYRRYSLLGGLITLTILLLGTLFVIINAFSRLFNPIVVNYDGMIILALVGCAMNFAAGMITHSNSINQKAVSLHLFEDMFGWITVLIGAIIIKFTQWYFIDPILSIGVSIFIGIHAVKGLLEIIDVFLIKTPKNINVDYIKQSLLIIPGIKDVHSIRIWSIDNENHVATLHVVAQYSPTLKQIIRNVLEKHNIYNSTIEFEKTDEVCKNKTIIVKSDCPCVHKH